ncbi:nucleotide triphosphate diphosphatase NUDT15 [Lingula anatina]|uniref:Nucleotide triphosphate diphosphatase NUDT15 n=1 Tax=Lingula anatina TaxID=7574 RepID=A0A1S3JVY2_LINAN|nr:nucleotide triphosphate diphosphatase NUDT15 [Lingula anatina]|eukprot:XP_013414214.1 nucleotide triphosphate diphosphatase NUDT15 [Lingula anatina]
MAVPTETRANAETPVFDAKLRPKVGVGVIVTSPNHPNCVIIGQRKGYKTGDLYALPGGHLEFGEEWNECAIREVQEETGLRLTRVDFATVVNVVWREHNLHYVTLFMQGEVESGCEPKNLEPEKCEGWQWCDWDNFPSPEELFLPLKLVRQQGYNPFVSKGTG